VAFDGAGNLYVADTANQVIRQIHLPNTVSTVAGTPLSAGWLDGPGSGAYFANPYGVAVAGGSVIVTDQGNNLIRDIASPASNPNVSTVAGNFGYRGYCCNPSGTVGQGTAYGTAEFDNPHDLTVDSLGNIYVSDRGNNVIRKITVATGAVTIFAGTVHHVGSTDGPANVALFNGPTGLTVDSHDNVFVTDFGNDTIRKITPAGVVSTVAGTAGNYGEADGTGAAAQFASPVSIAADASDNLYVADENGNTIRKITPAGVVSTYAGYAFITGSQDGTGNNGNDQQNNNSFYGPHGVAVNKATGIVYVADRFNGTIRRIDTSRTVSTIAGTAGLNDFVDGNGTNAHFNWPGSLFVDSVSGNLYVTDFNHNAVRKITSPDSTAAVTTVVSGPASSGPVPYLAQLGSLPGGLSGPSSVVVLPGVTAPTVKLAIADSMENAVLLATLP
jgi:hypothetical protein